MIDDTYQDITPTGNSGNAPGFAHGHPSAAMATWSIDPSSSGAFSGATGSGTDVFNVAGEAANGVIAGTVNLS